MNQLPLQQNDWINLLFCLALCVSLGWAFFDGRKRRSPHYRKRILHSLDRMPGGAKERFFTLFLPQKTVERATQSLIIGLGTAILMLPAWVVFGCLCATRPILSLFVTVLGGILGAVIGEFMFNHSAAKV